jgi:MtN3 and saliva related transmembrane protein
VTNSQAADLSLYMLLVLASGLALWIVYGFVQGDTVIIAANCASLALLGTIMTFKVREMISARRCGGAGGEADA